MSSKQRTDQTTRGGWRTQEQLLCVAVALRGGAAVGAAGPLPRPRRGQQGQLRGSDGAGAHSRPAVAKVPVLRGAAGPLGGSRRLGVLFGEEDGGAAAHLRGQHRGGGAQIWGGGKGGKGLLLHIDFKLRIHKCAGVQQEE